VATVAGWLEMRAGLDAVGRAGAVAVLGREITPGEEGLAVTRGDSRRLDCGRAGVEDGTLEDEAGDPAVLRAGTPPPTEDVGLRSATLPGRVEGSTALPELWPELPEGAGRPTTAEGRPGVRAALPVADPELPERGRAGTMPEAADGDGVPDLRASCRARIVDGGAVSRPGAESMRGR
jgi:hypothetical protein